MTAAADIEAEFDRRVRAARELYFEDLEREPGTALGRNQSRYFAICRELIHNPADRRYSRPLPACHL
jgi:hypothetical protein